MGTGDERKGEDRQDQDDWWWEMCNGGGIGITTLLLKPLTAFRLLNKMEKTGITIYNYTSQTQWAEQMRCTWNTGHCLK